MAKLLVSNISTLVNAQHLRELFNEFGELISVSECKKEGEAQTCIVEFKNVEDAKEALALSGTDLGDRTFEVKIIEDDSEKKEGSKKDGDEDKKKEDSKKPENKSKREDDDDDDSDSDGDRRSRRRRKGSRERGRRRRSRSRGRRRRRSSRSRERDRRRRDRDRGRRRRRRDSSSDDDEQYRRQKNSRKKKNINPTPTKFWDGFQWHDISAGQPQGMENRPLASQVNMSQLLKAQQEALNSMSKPTE
mmetsp:Transcript_2255/g.3243  ORF Transcript_2255/g.3243 Transcript_2255/m.3243 type:complete len:247 (+) Transcript_2255:38-778(+)